jgi:bile acid:Na+ symporter, BASS family
MCILDLHPRVIVMESNFLSTVFLPLALAIIMFGMGLTLTLADFKRIGLYPKAVAVGLTNQLLLLPVVGFLVASIFPLSPEIAVGLMILAFCPGGATSNLITHLCKGDVALSITLTAISSIVTIFTIPFLVNFSLQHFLGADSPIHLPIGDSILKILLITIVPTALGMWCFARFPKFTLKAQKSVTMASAVLFVVVVLGAVMAQRDQLGEFFRQAGPATLALNVIMMGLGYFSGKLLRLRHRQNVAISLESGLQNGTLAITIALTLLHNSEMSIAPAIYGLIMFFTAGIMIFLVRKVKETED